MICFTNITVVIMSIKKIDVLVYTW